MTDANAALYTERRPGVALPSIPGLVRGIVGQNPYEVQCDECLVVRSGDAQQKGLQVILADIRFNSRRYKTDRRRLCRECRAIHWTGDPQ